MRAPVTPALPEVFARECHCGHYARHGVEHPRGAEDCEFASTAPVEEPRETWRANYVPAPHFYNLNAACVLVREAFESYGHVGVYLCGSSIKRRDYRDVDVRLMMSDAGYDRLFGGPDAGHLSPLWSLLCVSTSAWLAQQTGLPIDFQIQRMTQANEAHSRKGGHDRQALGWFYSQKPPEPSSTGTELPVTDGETP